MYLKKGMELELAFVRAGGMLLAGADPTGNGGVLPGFGDQREMELLVEAGFTPLEAITIATLNGARFLGVADRVGSVAERACSNGWTSGCSAEALPHVSSAVGAQRPIGAIP